ncbi:MAG: hypothetical protein ABS76_22345 [Pelagibacterium sp. SCN 64-44]|nr:MAG: hypothetical protein ABS76_22345 [Pelagibacterium sp. SCN 64-44]
MQLPAGAGPQLLAKRLVDIGLSLAALLVLAPLLLLLMVLIKATSGGPAVFRQVREGRNGVPFVMFKFRSTRAEAADPSGLGQITRDDPRVTGIGRFIRRTGLDELPQLINVLRGDMSLVGPRPHVPGMLAGGCLYRDLVSGYDRRLVLRPGITGWAQANGLRGATDDAVPARARIEHDLAYIQNYSLLLDLKIMLLTLRKQCWSETAY